MSYVDRNLLQGEEVVYRARLHRLIFLPPALIAIAGLAVGIFVHPIAGAIVGVAALLVFIPRYVRYMTSEFAVTNRRVIVKVGLVHRHTLELVLAKVETVGVDQGVLGRIFNFGTIIVTGTGGTQEPFKNIADPLGFRKMVQSEQA
jgi:uncharacterized membrane protein YdbT with pleckstrin-like domain